MFILRNILFPLQQEFNHRCKGDERGVWFVYTLLGCYHSFHLFTQRQPIAMLAGIVRTVA